MKPPTADWLSSEILGSSTTHEHDTRGGLMNERIMGRIMGYQAENRKGRQEGPSLPRF